MDILYGPDAGRAEGISSEPWRLDNVYTFEPVEFERGLSPDMEFNADAIFYTDMQQPLTLYTPPNSLVWPSLSLDIQQLNTTRYLLPSSMPSYSTQIPTSYTSPSNTDSVRRQQQPKKFEQQSHGNDKSDESEIRCWNHNCDGRRFSSMGNYRRHLREKAGNAKRHQCQDCGRFFTRSTSRNTHRQLGTCRKRKASTSGILTGTFTIPVPVPYCPKRLFNNGSLG